MRYEAEKQIALAAVKAAAQLCQQIRQTNFTPLTKADRSPVTLADLGAQAVICQYLAEAFGDDPVIAEEDAAILQQQDLLAQVTRYIQAIIPEATPDRVTTWIDRGNGKIASRYWTLDPIDGTKGFIRGDQYAIALALVEQGQVKLGVMGCPSLSLPATGDTGVIFVAVENEGTLMMSLDGSYSQPITVNQWDEPNQLRSIESVESTHSDRAQQEAVAKLLGMTQPPLQMDSQAKYGAVARGEAALYLRIPLAKYASRRENIWDHAAGAIVVTEAGGRVSDLDGQPLDFSISSQLERNRGIVVSNGIIHKQVLKAIAKVERLAVH